MITFTDCIGFARLYGSLPGNSNEGTTTQKDKDGAANVLKEMADRQSKMKPEDQDVIIEIIHRCFL